ncbi:TetR/AcrR family transcriptional regulator [Nocardioides convexus]|uniref:TetR/AcrR family transcriptional regulator n=1 Tax=Nocardioides convexus TaxID=2712224 RepID=UPI002418525E|nr:TetR/AcrR family transcriptional regulator [Nocardioides convexus]
MTGLSRLERRKAETRAEIIEAAFTCFAEQGYHATGIADIAARLGIGHGTFYRYFQNKRDIVEHVVDDLIGRIVEALGADNAPDAVSTLEDYRAQTERIGTALSRIFSDDPRMAQPAGLRGRHRRRDARADAGVCSRRRPRSRRSTSSTAYDSATCAPTSTSRPPPLPSTG